MQDPATRPAVVSAAGHTQQLAYRAVADRPGWDRRVADLLPGALRRDTRANVAARREFRSMHPTRDADLATELPAWRIVEPRPAAELRRYYREAERRFGVDWEYLAAINLVETGFGRIDGTSVAGAQGPMQFIPTTWDIYGAGGDIEDPHDAILAAGRLLRANGFAARPGRRAAALQQLLGVRARGDALRRGDAAPAAHLPRLPPVADLLPDPRGQRLAARGLRRAAARPGAAVAAARAGR